MNGAKRKRDGEEQDVDVTALRGYLKKEETKLREGAGLVLNQEVIDRIEAVKALELAVIEEGSFVKALESGVVKRCRAELTACFRVGVRLECWLNTFTPPLSSGGNVMPRALEPHRGRCPSCRRPPR